MGLCVNCPWTLQGTRTMNDNKRWLPAELRIVAETKFAGMPHAEVLLQAAEALEQKKAPLVDMPLFMEGRSPGDAFLRSPWPMTATDFQHRKTSVVSIYDIYSWVEETAPTYPDPTEA